MPVFPALRAVHPVMQRAVTIASRTIPWIIPLGAVVWARNLVPIRAGKFVRRQANIAALHAALVITTTGACAKLVIGPATNARGSMPVTSAAMIISSKEACVVIPTARRWDGARAQLREDNASVVHLASIKTQPGGRLNAQPVPLVVPNAPQTVARSAKAISCCREVFVATLMAQRPVPR